MNRTDKTASNKAARMAAALAFGVPALLGGVFAPPASAQAASSASAVADTADKTVTLDLVNTSLPTALRLLFQKAGIAPSQYTIAPDVQGLTTIQVQDVPVGVALGALLRSATPAAAYTLDNGVYAVTRKPFMDAAPAGPAPRSARAGSDTRVASSAAGSSASGSGAKIYGTIPVNRYDAFMIAEMLGAQGIAPVGANTVISVPTGAGIGLSDQGGQNGGQGYGGQNGGQGGYGGQNGGQGGGYGGGYGRGRRRNRGGNGGGGYYGG